jgi:WD40 repeat protein
MRVLLAGMFLITGIVHSASAAPVEAPAKPDVSVDRHSDALPAGAFHRLGTVRFRNGAGIFTITYSPDGKWIASAGGTPWAAQGVSSGDRTIRIWEVHLFP